MRKPPLTATYRIQLHSRFTLRDALRVVPYLDRLGISHLYCSPVLAARTGSEHGYDVVDPTRLNPELGTEDDWRRLADDLHSRGMGLLLDIVPNHMAVSRENPYWDDVLAKGKHSPYAHWFDIDWPSSGRARVVLPVLGDLLDRVVAREQMTLRVEDDRARIHYFDDSFPVDPSTLVGDVPLDELLDRQHYRLTHWKNPGNYRRFFDVNDLVGLRQEDDTVFEATHALVLRWISEGIVDGLRVDHIDGLADPAKYLRHLRDRGVELVIVEKILSYEERLPENWPVAGTTGYDFLNDLDDVALDPFGMSRLEELYAAMRKLPRREFETVARHAKRRVLATSFRGDVQRLARRLRPLAAARKSPLTQSDARGAITSWVARLPVYRTYLAPNEEPSAIDRALIANSQRDAIKRDLDHATGVFALASVLEATTPETDLAQSTFIARLQQLSGAAAAKGIEDSAFYQYVPLVSRNEVGGSPDRPTRSAVQRFHERSAERASRWPRGLVCTTTHDTKRSADVRSRLAALTEIATEWDRAVRRWRHLNKKHRLLVSGRLVPDTNTEYLLYQTLVGIWPLPGQGRRMDDLPNAVGLGSMMKRVNEYILKAAREANLFTSWREPKAEYETGLLAFVEKLFEEPSPESFLGDVARMVALAASIGECNTLSRVVLHLTSPGTPDIYQGDEYRDLEVVDPDNRHTVNFEFLSNALSRTESDISGVGPSKLAVVHRVLRLRRAHPGVFAGGYEPLVCEGPRAPHVIAFARRNDDGIVVTIAGRLLREYAALPPAERASYWRGTNVILPPDLDGQAMSDAITGSAVACADNRLELSSALIHLPVAVLSSS